VVEQLTITDRLPDSADNSRDPIRNSCIWAATLAATDLGAAHIRKRLGLGSVALEQLMARHGIQLPGLRGARWSSTRPLESKGSANTTGWPISAFFRRHYLRHRQGVGNWW